MKNEEYIIVHFPWETKGRKRNLYSSFFILTNSIQ